MHFHISIIVLFIIELQTVDGEEDMKKGTQLLEIYALEIQMYTAQVCEGAFSLWCWRLKILPYICSFNACFDRKTWEIKDSAVNLNATSNRKFDREYHFDWGYLLFAWVRHFEGLIFNSFSCTFLLYLSKSISFVEK